MKNLSVSLKLTIGFGIIVLILIFVGRREFYLLKASNKNHFDVVKNAELADNIMEAKYLMRTDMQLLMEMITATQLKELTEINDEHLETIKAFDEKIENLLRIASDQDWGKNYSDTKENIIKTSKTLENIHNNKVVPLINEAFNIKQKMLSGSSENLSQQLNEIDDNLDKNGAEVIGILTDIESSIEEINNIATEKNLKAEKSAKIEIYIIAAIALILTIFIATIITRSIVRQLGGEPAEVAEIAKKISNGDLSGLKFIESKEYIGVMKDMKEMAERIKEIVVSIISNSENIASASFQLSSTAQELSQGATEQASSTEEVSSSMEEMAANVQQNSENAQQTEKMTIEVNEGISEVANRAKKAVDANKTILEKVSVINDIAFQTNILALNAAVEAARAGEHGKGFAVVAAEVRKLAERSKIAAEQIVGLNQVSYDLANGAGEVMMNTLPKVEKNTKLIQEIAAASIEQNAGVDQINNAIQQLNKVTQQNAAASEELSTSSEELASQAKQLKELISFFNIGNNYSTQKNMTNTSRTHFSDNSNKKQKLLHSKPDVSGVHFEMNDKMNNDNEYEKFV